MRAVHILLEVARRDIGLTVTDLAKAVDIHRVQLIEVIRLRRSLPEKYYTPLEELLSLPLGSLGNAAATERMLLAMTNRARHQFVIEMDRHFGRFIEHNPRPKCWHILSAASTSGTQEIRRFATWLGLISRSRSEDVGPDISHSKISSDGIIANLAYDPQPQILKFNIPTAYLPLLESFSVTDEEYVFTVYNPNSALDSTVDIGIPV